MKRSRNLSIRTKLILLVAITIILSQTISLGLSVWHEMSRFASTKKDSMFATAEIIAASAAKSLAERNSNEAYQSIRAIGRIKGLTFAGLEDLSANLFADVGATEQLASDITLENAQAPISPLRFLYSKSIEVKVPVVYAGTVVGALRLVGEAGDLPDRIRAAISATITAALVALGLALALVFQLQTAITKPLLSLSEAMARITKSNNFSVALPKVKNDEVGILVEGFNEMMTNIRERDDRLTAHRARLEYDIAERTKDYQRAAAEAKSANNAKSDFLATMSHEIRTPMNGILVMAELLATADLPNRERRQAEVIARSGNSLLAIINDILDFSKIEAGKLEVETMDVDAAVAIDTVLHLFADKAQSKGLDLAVMFTLDRNAAVIADPVRLGQVLSNLVNNAIKFTEAGGVTIAVEHSQSRQGYVDFSVIDTGIGIPADKLGTIFDAFSQADQTTTRKFGGTGLGLSIARRLVAAMGGELFVESQFGAGTRFYFSLPVSHMVAVAPWYRVPAVRRAIICINGKQSEKSLASILEAAGFDVRIALPADLHSVASGAALVIVDPPELLKQVRLPVALEGAVVTLTKPTEDISHLIQSGLADAALSWPFMRTDLSGIVEAIGGGRAIRDISGSRTTSGVDYSAVRGLRVLVADDSEVNREVAQAALQKLGISPDLVEDGRQAFDAVFANQYDVVLMDGSMPDIDGFEATKLIRAREQSEMKTRTNVIALTAHVIGTAAEAWRDAGMDGVLHKPFTLAQMFEALLPFASTGAPENSVERPLAFELEAPPKEPVPGVVVQDVEMNILDLSVLAELRQMTSQSPEVTNRIIRLYCAQSDEHFGAILDAVHKQNSDQLGKAAHALKSMSYNVGAIKVAALAGSFERTARETRTCVSHKMAEELNRELVKVKDALLEQIA